MKKYTTHKYPQIAKKTNKQANKNKQIQTNKQRQKKKYTTHKYPQKTKKQINKQTKTKQNTKQNKKQEPLIPVTNLFLQHKSFNQIATVLI